MKQIIPKVFTTVGFGGGTAYGGPNDGEGDIANSLTFGIDSAKIPLPFDVTFRNLTVGSHIARTAPVTVTLLSEGVATAQLATLIVADDIVYSAGADVALTAGTDIAFKFVGPTIAFPGYSLGTCIEAESIGNVFGIAPDAGGKSIGNGWIGGAFGNGVWEGYSSGAPTVKSNTYSLCAVEGDVTHLCLRTYRTDLPDAGSWVGYIQKNGVLQDGSGGTVDTTTTLTGASTFVINTFAVPCTFLDRLEVVVIRQGTDASTFMNANVAAGIGFTPTTDGEFMQCGGSNDSISAVTTSWKWTRSEQLGTPEGVHQAPTGPLGWNSLGMYIERSAPPGAGDSYIHTLRLNGGDTTTVVTISGAVDDDGFIVNTVPFVAGDFVDIESEPTGSPLAVALYWGLAGNVSTPATTLLTIIKQTDPPGSPQVFDYVTTGGLTPQTFSLSDGQSQTYTDPAPGIYGIEEIVPDGWDQPQVSVSSGYPVSGIVIAEDDDVTVIFTNTETVPPEPCPGTTGSPPQDGLPYTPMDAEPCEGPGEDTGSPIGR